MLRLCCLAAATLVLGAAAADVPAASPGDALLAYLADVQQARSGHGGRAVEQRFERALSGLADRPDRTWTLAAARALAYRRAAGAVASAFAALRAPAGLERAHAGLVRSARLRAQLAGEVRVALLDRDPAALLRLFTRIDTTLGPRIAALDGGWRKAVAAAARSARVALPAWVQAFGSGQR